MAFAIERVQTIASDIPKGSFKYRPGSVFRKSLAVALSSPSLTPPRVRRPPLAVLFVPQIPFSRMR